MRDRKNIFLTYPKTDIPKANMLAFFRGKLGFSLKQWVIAQEFHEDGKPHIHAYLKIDPVLKTRDVRYFDF